MSRDAPTDDRARARRTDGGDGEADGSAADEGRGMAVSADELAGLVDLFGGLTRAELERALAELAARQGTPADADIEAAVRSYHLIAVDPGAVLDESADVDVKRNAGAEADTDANVDGDDDTDGPDLLLVGPVAFPTLPPGAEDVPHVLDIPERTVDRAGAVDRVEERLRGDAARAVVAEDIHRIHHLLDVTYDLETWADADVADARTRLDAALEELTEE
jgi:hypothetical protein